ncbi:hypothetical protein WOLCODRAFT_167642 [Wolfiporia cocos MD-104 SS10]|uniref:Uncharacterized protein n=1 Tax=Wolfiporia cocos (strain MD-104) TaxID=742152 RepID=A0A2H3JG60_WOLCO|nr:hypothetical protein WOLCODRAFT_167642 [Wolfiporia cocos MD-104 SS10]
MTSEASVEDLDAYGALEDTNIERAYLSVFDPSPAQTPRYLSAPSRRYLIARNSSVNVGVARYKAHNARRGSQSKRLILLLRCAEQRVNEAQVGLQSASATRRAFTKDITRAAAKNVKHTESMSLASALGRTRVRGLSCDQRSDRSSCPSRYWCALRGDLAAHAACSRTDSQVPLRQRQLALRQAGLGFARGILGAGGAGRCLWEAAACTAEGHHGGGSAAGGRTWRGACEVNARSVMGSNRRHGRLHAPAGENASFAGPQQLAVRARPLPPPAMAPSDSSDEPHDVSSPPSSDDDRSDAPVPFPPRSPPARSFASSPLNPHPVPPGTAPIPLPPRAPRRPDPAPIARIASEETHALAHSPAGTPRGSMVLYRLASPAELGFADPASAGALLAPPRLVRDSVLSGASRDSSLFTLAADSKYPLNGSSPRRLVPYAFDPLADAKGAPAEDEDEDDWLFALDVDGGGPRAWASWRGLVNVGMLTVVIVAILVLFISYPVITFYRNDALERGITEGVNVLNASAVALEDSVAVGAPGGVRKRSPAVAFSADARADAPVQSPLLHLPLSESPSLLSSVQPPSERTPVLGAASSLAPPASPSPSPSRLAPQRLRLPVKSRGPRRAEPVPRAPPAPRGPWEGCRCAAGSLSGWMDERTNDVGSGGEDGRTDGRTMRALSTRTVVGIALVPPVLDTFFG